MQWEPVMALPIAPYRRSCRLLFGERRWRYSKGTKTISYLGASVRPYTIYFSRFLITEEQFQQHTTPLELIWNLSFHLVEMKWH
jgi:hypothetical protein